MKISFFAVQTVQFTVPNAMFIHTRWVPQPYGEHIANKVADCRLAKRAIEDGQVSYRRQLRASLGLHSVKLSLDFQVFIAQLCSFASQRTERAGNRKSRRITGADRNAHD